MSRRRRKPPPPPTEWWHVLLALALTFLALGSWAAAGRGPSGTVAGGAGAEGPSEGDEGEDAPLRRFSIAASGDVLLHEPVYARAAANASGGGYDFTPMFEHIEPIVEEADLGICHMETPVSRDNTDVASYPVFNAPRQIVTALIDAGFDLCSTASNHSFDKGAQGVLDTLKVFERAGLPTEGTAEGEREARLPELLEVNGVRVGHLSFTYGLNGFVLPQGEEHLVNVIDVDKILKHAERAKRKGAEFVVLSLHWGLEFQTDPTPEQLVQARKLIKSEDIDLILGHHTHVPQPIQKIKDELVIFGMGNFISNQRPGATPTCCLPETQDGLLVRVDVQETEDGWETSAVYWPTWVRPETFEILPTASAANDPAFDSLRDSLIESWKRTKGTVNALGAKKEGVLPAERP